MGQLWHVAAVLKHSLTLIWHAAFFTQVQLRLKNPDSRILGCKPQPSRWPQRAFEQGDAVGYSQVRHPELALGGPGSARDIIYQG